MNGHASEKETKLLKYNGDQSISYYSGYYNQYVDVDLSISSVAADALARPYKYMYQWLTTGQVFRTISFYEKDWTNN